MKQDERYQARGVSAQKNDVHQAIKNLDKGEFPNAFAKILPDVITPNAEESDYVNLMHADTAGTKTVLAYLQWKESGDVNVWKGIAQDAIVMNTDDMLCVGCCGPIVLSSTIGRNAHVITKEVIAAIIQGGQELINEFQEMGLDLVSSGGETADVGDIVRTADVGYTAFARMERKAVIENNIRPGQKIVGLASYGQATYEKFYNSGIGSNGLTSARHDVLSKHYADEYPEAYAPQTDKQYVFTGSHRLSDTYEGHRVSDLILSPTRTYFPVIKAMLDHHASQIHGMIHCTGGGQTKVLKFAPGVTIEKNNMLAVPPVFRLIQESSGASLHEMYQVFNMGHRMELYVDAEAVDDLIAISNQYGIDAACIGEVTEEKDYRLKIKHGDDQFITY